MRLCAIIALLWAAAGPAVCQGIITTLAGQSLSSSCTPTGDGGPASSANLCGAQSTAVDASGNIYFYDYGDARIRKIATGGIITAIAGNGISGTAGDGGPALDANLGSIRQLAVDPSGQRICFGDASAEKIRCVSLATGLIQGYGTGVAAYGGAGDGGNVANASFNDPVGAAFDSAGNLYISDSTDERVRRVDALTNVITTYVGPGPGYCCAATGDGGPAAGANLYQPEGLAYANGGLYIADSGNNRVRLVNLATGIITTVAGNGSPNDDGVSDNGPALQAGITLRWIALDSSGNLFVQSATGVRMVNTSGIITTIAGSLGIDGFGEDDIPATQTVFAGISGLGFDAVADRLLVTDNGQRIRQVFFTPPTTTTFTITPGSAYPGEQVTLTANVFPADATGNVRFHQGSTVLGSVPVVNGMATFNWTPTSANTYQLNAVYGGDPTHNLSSSPAVSLPVQWLSTSTALSSSLNPSVQGQTVTFTAIVSPSSATGSVTFTAAGTGTLGTIALSNGVAKLTTSALPAGLNYISANYIPGACCSASYSFSLGQMVKVATATAISSSVNPSIFGSAITLSAVVTPSTATGSVQFFNGSALLGSAALLSGKAQYVIAGLPAGNDSLTALYSGDANDGASTSVAISEVVNKASSSTIISASPAAQSNLGQVVTFNAAVQPAAATGTVQFLDGSVVIGAAKLNAGTAVLTTSSLGQGSHSIKASYGGDGSVNPSSSAALTYKVKR